MTDRTTKPRHGRGQAVHDGRSKSMHEGIAVWCDCCSCEAEPYWVEAGERLGIDPGSDYEPTEGSERDEDR